jgi:hypothetical protein
MLITPYDDYPYYEMLKDLGEYPVLIGRLAYEKFGRDSGFFHRFVSSLQTGEFTQIMLWSDEDVTFFEEISNIPLDRATTDDPQMKLFGKYRDRLKGDPLIKPVIYSKETYRWALLMIKSRSFTFTVK